MFLQFTLRQSDAVQERMAPSSHQHKQRCKRTKYIDCNIWMMCIADLLPANLRVLRVEALQRPPIPVQQTQPNSALLYHTGLQRPDDILGGVDPLLQRLCSLGWRYWIHPYGFHSSYSHVAQGAQASHMVVMDNQLCHCHILQHCCTRCVCGCHQADPPQCWQLWSLCRFMSLLRAV